MSRLLRATLVLLVIGLVGCNRNQPIYTVEDSRLPKATESLTQDQIKNNIIQAALDKGWHVDEVGPGELRVTMRWKDHEAISSILYSKTGYSIKLDSSRNLKQQNGTIHRKYNQAVQALQNEIDKHLYRPTH